MPHRIRRTSMVALLALPALLACGSGSGATLDARDAIEVGAEVLGADSGNDTPDAASPVASWTDPATGLTWEKHPTDASVNWELAGQHCRDLEGGSGWRLPTIDELRSIIRGCPTTMTGGACLETDQCSAAAPTCYNDQACMGCDWLGGPGLGGCYWPVELEGACEWTWSATTASDLATYACFAHFANAHLSHDVKANGAPAHHVMCVR